MRHLCRSTWCPHPPDNGSNLRVNHLSQKLVGRHRLSAVVLPVGLG